jgi:FAD-dependent oxidoreductase domain-containing protein 1
MHRSVIVGGGIVGACCALFLADGAGEVTVLERDPAYRFASTTLSAASIRVQFSLPLNLHMSLFGAAFMEARAERIGLVRSAYLTLAGPAGEAVLRENHAMQTAEGGRVALLSPGEMAARFPWLNVADLAAGALGLEHEGWFDAYALLRAVREEAAGRGARFLHAEATGFDIAGGRVRAVRTADGATLPADVVVNAAGPAAGRLAALAGLRLPVEPRKRTVFVLRAPLTAPGMPLVFDTTGAWIRPEGDGFIAGIAPPEAEDPDATGDFDPDMDLLESTLWPALAHRIPAFEQLRVQRAWAGHYEVCTLDHNAVVGPHPELANFIFANGFSGHGVQHGPATGRAVAELVRQGRYVSLDLTPLGYARIAEGRPMPERAIY